MPQQPPMGPPMGPPQAPPGLPPPQGGPPPLPPEVEQYLANLPPEIQQVVRQMPTDVLMQFLSAPDPGAQADVLLAFVRSMQGPAGLVGPDGLPIASGQPDPTAAPPNGPPVGAPPGVPVPGMAPPGLPPAQPVVSQPQPLAMMPDGSMSLVPPPPAPPAPPPPVVPLEPLMHPDEPVDTGDEEGVKARPKPPAYELPELPKNRYGKDGPSSVLVEADGALLKRRYQARNEAIQAWHDVYNQIPDGNQTPDGKRLNPYKSKIMVPSTQTTMADRLFGLVAPTTDRLKFKAQPPDDSAESRDATQAKRNAARSIWEQLERNHVRRVSNDGHIRGSLARMGGGIMTIEGSMPALVDMNPEDKRLPFTFEFLPVHEVYPGGHATMRIFEATLGELRSAWPLEVNAAYPLDEDGPRPDEETRLTVQGWSDERWHGIWASLPKTYTRADRKSASYTRKKDDKGGCWLKPMAEHKNGWRVYQYGLPALASPLVPTGAEVDIASMTLTRGIYAAYGPLFKIQSRLFTAVTEGAFKAIRPPYKYKLANPRDTPNPIDDSPGGAGVTLRPGEDVEPMLTALMDTKSGQTLLEFISVMIGEMMPPVTQGRGQAASGADRFIAQQQAAALHVDPIIQGIQDTLSFYLSLLLEGFYRKSQGQGAWVTPFPIRQHTRPVDQDSAGATLAVLVPDDIAIAGPEVRVEYMRYSLAERLQLAALMKNLIDAHLISRMDAMEELGVDDYERTMARQLFEAVYEDPEGVKSNIDALMEEQLDPPKNPKERARRRTIRVARAWQRSRQAALQGPQGSQAAPIGTPSPPAMPQDANSPGMPPADMQQ